MVIGFFREFSPENGPVDDWYWIEKLEINSVQKGTVYDPLKTQNRIREKIKELRTDKYLTKDRKKEYIDYLKDSVEFSETKKEYLLFIENHFPQFPDYDEVIIEESINPQLEFVF